MISSRWFGYLKGRTAHTLLERFPWLRGDLNSYPLLESQFITIPGTLTNHSPPFAPISATSEKLVDCPNNPSELQTAFQPSTALPRHRISRRASACGSVPHTIYARATSPHLASHAQRASPNSSGLLSPAKLGATRTP